MSKTRFGIIKAIVLFLLALFCIASLSACANYGEEVTYYSLNTNNSIHFDGKGNCVFDGVDASYEIKDGYYYIRSKNKEDGNNTLYLKIVRDGVLLLSYRETGDVLDISARSGFIDARLTATGNVIIDFRLDGTYTLMSGYAISSMGNYFYNDGVLVLKQTVEQTIGGDWIFKESYLAFYVNEGTGKLSGVLLTDPDYYKQWHFDAPDTPEVPDTRHALTYDLNYDGITLKAQSIAKGETIELPVPERAGYEFLGWYDGYDKVESGIWQYDRDVTLTAQWQATQYSITYNTDGGVLPENHLQNFTVESDLPYTLPVPVKDGSNFAGWYENADFSGDPIAEIPKDGLRDYTLYARYTNEELLEYELSFDETYYSIVGWKGSPQYISVPDEKDGVPVKEIAASAFRNCDSLIDITLPDGITKIGDYAFYNCNSLTSINLPDELTTIGDDAFHYCRNLTNVTFPDELTTIGDYAFYYCSNLTNITFPDALTTIGTDAFYYCVSLTSINLPDALTTIESHAFSECNNLTSVVLPDSILDIGDGAFPTNLYKRYGGCYYLPTKSSGYGLLYQPVSDSDAVNIKVHAECKTINARAFSECNSLTSVIFPEGLTTISDRAFDDCDNLTSINLPDELTTIGEYAFDDCDNLTSITFPNGLATIGEYAFFHCDSLTSISLPNGLTTIGDDAFASCWSLTHVYYEGTAENWSGISIGEDALPSSAQIYFFKTDEPTDDGNYWHFDTDGKTPVVWDKKYIEEIS